MPTSSPRAQPRQISTDSSKRSPPDPGPRRCAHPLPRRNGEVFLFSPNGRSLKVGAMANPVRTLEGRARADFRKTRERVSPLTESLMGRFVGQDHHREAKGLRLLVPRGHTRRAEPTCCLDTKRNCRTPWARASQLVVYAESVQGSAVLVLRRKFPPAECQMAVGCYLSVATSGRGPTNPRRSSVIVFHDTEWGRGGQRRKPKEEHGRDVLTSPCCRRTAFICRRLPTQQDGLRLRALCKDRVVNALVGARKLDIKNRHLCALQAE